MIAFFVYFPDRFLPFQGKQLGCRLPTYHRFFLFTTSPLVSGSFNYFDYSLFSFVPVDLERLPFLFSPA